MAGTRVQRARDAKKPDVEELRFDFSGEEAAPERSGSPPREAEVARPTDEVEDDYDLVPLLSVVAPGPERSLSVVPTEPVFVPGSASDAAMSVSDFYDRVRGALREAFPDEIWVTGEICKVTTSRGHHYLELADHLDAPAGLPSDGSPPVRYGPGRSARATLEVACWARDWPVVQYELESVGVELVPGLVVRVRGKVSVWEGGSKIRFSMTALDIEALVGGIAAARRRLLGALASEGLL